VLDWRDNKLFATLSLFALAQLNPEQHATLQQRLDNFTNNVWRSNKISKRYRWDMAILVNPEEETPPSDQKALNNFVKAANKFGINAELVTVAQIGLLNRYDALFIRETTAIRHHTYQLARQAEKEGLVVIDDATSILRCCTITKITVMPLGCKRLFVRRRSLTGYLRILGMLKPQTLLVAQQH
jgi:hypothetical protein